MGSESYANVNAPPQGAGDELDLTGIAAVIGRRKKLIIGVTGLCILGALAFIIVVKPTYTADARVLIENQESYFTRPDRKSASVGPVAPDSEAVASQVQLITSRDLGREAIRKLGLKGNPEFDPLAGGTGLLTRVLEMTGLKSAAHHLAPEDRMLENYSKRLTVFAVPKSRVVTIKFSAKDPRLSARGANTIADLYIGVQQQAKMNQAKVAAVSLAGLISEMRGKLALAESKVEAFRAKSGLLMGANNALIPSQQLAEINTELAAARTKVADAQATARLIRRKIKQGRLSEVTEVARDNLVRRIGGQRATLRAQIASDARTLGPAHPRMKEFRARLASVDNQLRSAAVRVARALENDANVAGVRVANLKAAIDRQKKRVGATSVDQVRLRELELEAKLIREQLENSLTKYREALTRQRSRSTPGDARIISRAVEPQRPSFPKKLPFLIFAALGGFVLSLGYVVSGELLSGRAYAARQYGTGFAPAPPMQVAAQAIDQDNAKRPPTPSGEPAHAAPVLSRAAARLTEKLAAMNTKGYGRRLLICPENSGIDHAATIEPLARALSVDKRVVLLDLSGRLEAAHGGLAELLEGITSFTDVIERDEGSRLHIIARGWSEVPIGEDFDAVIDALSQTYDFVILIAPGEAGHRTALQLAPAADLAVIAAAAKGAAASALRDQLIGKGAGDVALLRAAPDDHGSVTREAAAA